MLYPMIVADESDIIHTKDEERPPVDWCEPRIASFGQLLGIFLATGMSLQEWLDTLETEGGQGTHLTLDNREPRC